MVHRGYVDLRSDGEYIFVPNNPLPLLIEGTVCRIQDCDLPPFLAAIGEQYVTTEGDIAYVITECH